jgi:mannosyl-oligosaccharide alpha-1,2-mannosidase
MLVMGMADSEEYKRALKHAKHIDFTNTKMGDYPGKVSIFELTIRCVNYWLAGWLAGKLDWL